MDGGGFATFKERRELWIKCLAGDDRNSVMQQIHRMIWNTAVFRIINESRRMAPPDEDGGFQLNGPVHRLITEGFFDGQMLAIRRLTDGYPIATAKCKRDVCCITGVLDDMLEHAHLMTRENMLLVEAHEEHTIPDLDRLRKRELHEQMDLFAGVKADQRSPSDSVRPEVMKCLQKRVHDVSERFHVYVDKFIAHAASYESRQWVQADDLQITLNELYEGQKVICQTANFIDLRLLRGTNNQVLAIPQYDHLAYIDRPLATKDSVATLAQAWRDFDMETQEWSNWGMDGFRREFAAGNPAAPPK